MGCDMYVVLDALALIRRGPVWSISSLLIYNTEIVGLAGLLLLYKILYTLP
jgi:hypothetical protein